MATTALAAALRKVATTATANAPLAAGRHTPVSATGAARTMTLPTGQREGIVISVEKTDSSTNAVTITGHIRGVATQSVALATQYEGVEFMADANGSWWPLSASRAAAAAVTKVDWVQQNADGTWPARPTASTSVLVFWRCISGGADPAEVASGTGGAHTGRDVVIRVPA